MLAFDVDFVDSRYFRHTMRLSLCQGIRHMDGRNRTKSRYQTVAGVVMKGDRLHDAIAEPPNSEQICPNVRMVSSEDLPLGRPIRH